MGTISIPTTFSPNTTIASSQVNSNFSTIYNEFNGNISAANLAADAVSTAKIADSAVTSAKIADNAVTNAKLASQAMGTWAPTYANLTVGDGTVTAKYIQIGKIVRGRWNLLAGSTTSIGSSVTVSAPVTAHADYGSLDNAPIGNLLVLDSGTAVYTGVVQFDNSATVMALRYYELPSGTYTRAVTTIPITEASGDNWSINFEYEAA